MQYSEMNKLYTSLKQNCAFRLQNFAEAIIYDMIFKNICTSYRGGRWGGKVLFGPEGQI